MASEKALTAFIAAMTSSSRSLCGIQRSATV
jgi:hypothetical protein